jgi:acyl-CoA reductase-like NAD-dependent aldehyde dehydrogenase
LPTRWKLFNGPGYARHYGGLKQSGYGKDLSAYALEDYTVARHVMVKNG